MKRMFLSLGLSVTILLSAAFAQGTMQRRASGSQQATVSNSIVSTKDFVNAQKVSHLANFKHKKVVLNFATAKTQPVIRYQACYPSPKPSGKATIKLINDIDYGDGSGFQILMDNTHQLMDDFLDYFNDEEITQEAMSEVYEAATDVIPANASPVLGTTSILTGKSDSTAVDPGTYDLLIVSPTPLADDVEPGSDNVYLYLAGWDAGAFDDLKFEANYTYVFQVIQNGFYDKVIFLPPIAITLESLVLSTVNCQTTEAEVSLVITNEGNLTIPSCEVFYTYKGINDTLTKVFDTVKSTVTFPNGGLAMGKTFKFTFEQKIAFPKDTIYAVAAGIQPLDAETETGDNYAEDLLVKKPTVDVPYEFNIAQYDITFSGESWITGLIDENTVAMAPSEMGMPAVTRCISMEANQAYRLSFDGQFGQLVWGLFEFPTTYVIKCGKVSEDISTWDTLCFEEDAFIEGLTPQNVIFTAKEAGDYAFCFYEDTSSYGGGFIIANVAVSEVLDKDVKLDAFYGMPSMMPIEHVNRTYVANYEAVNWGSENVDKATLKITLNNQEIASKDIALGKTGEVKTGTINIPVTGLTNIADAVFSATLDFAGDEDLENNTKSRTIMVTDNIMAYDFVTEDMYSEDGIGNNYAFGVPFSITQKDTLTGIVAGFAETTKNVSMSILIHQWSPETMTLGNLLYESIERRETEAGPHTYTIPALLLEPGDYIVSIQQIGEEFLDLLVDGTKEGIFYITSTDPVGKISGMGTPMIRAMFGHDGKPVAKDMMVSEITKPKEIGRFAENQEVVAMVINNGYEAVKAVPVTLSINDKTVTTKNLDLDAYGRQEVSFTADLSTPNTKYVLKVSVALEGDENPENNEATKTIQTLGPVNPYIMDFEDCEDYAIGDEFVPAWKSIDLSDASYSYGYRTDYLHRQEVVGFMAIPTGLGGNEAHAGERLGIAFGVGDENDNAVQSNAWLISPKLQLTANNAKMSFYVKSATADYGLEKYNVMISSTDDNPESFTKIGETREAPAEDWTLVEVDLAEYAGKEVHLAIQHVSFDVFALLIDDIVVGTGTFNNRGVASIRLNAWPNPASEMVYISADQAIEQVCIYTPAGNLLYQSADNMNAEEFRYSVKNLNSGLYIARVKTAQGTGVVKFVVR